MWHLGRMKESAVGWQGIGRPGHAGGGCALSVHVGQMVRLSPRGPRRPSPDPPREPRCSHREVKTRDKEGPSLPARDLSSQAPLLPEALATLGSEGTGTPLGLKHLRLNHVHFSFFLFLTFTELSSQPHSGNVFRASWIVSCHLVSRLTVWNG